MVDSAALTPASTVSRLCARSAARYASSRSASACTLAVTSACTPTKFVSLPSPSNTGDIDTSFQNAVPSLR